MARPTIPTLHEFRRTRLSKGQVQTFSYVLRAIALGRLPGDQTLSRQAVLTRLFAALALSIALWIYTTQQDNPVVHRSYTVQVVPRHVPKHLAIRSGLIPVTVTAQGLQSTLNSSQTLHAYVDLSGLASNSGEAVTKVLLAGGRSDVDYTFDPATLSLTLEPQVSKSVPVIFNPLSTLPGNLVQVGQQIAPLEVTVQGPKDQVDQVKNALVSAPLSGVNAPSNTTASFTQGFSLVPQLVDGQGRLIAASNSITVKQLQVEVTLQIQQVQVTRILSIAPIILSAPPPGYLLAPAQPEPPIVVVQGPPESFTDQQSVVTTEPIDVSNLMHSATISTVLILPPNVTAIPLSGHRIGSNLHAPRWKIRLTITRSQTNQTLNAGVVLDHLAARYLAHADTRSVQVQLGGAYVDIARLGTLMASLNLSGFRPGSYDLRPTVRLPAGLRLYGVTPSTVHVTIQPRPGTGRKSR